MLASLPLDEIWFLLWSVLMYLELVSDWRPLALEFLAFILGLLIYCELVFLESNMPYLLSIFSLFALNLPSSAFVYLQSLYAIFARTLL